MRNLSYTLLVVVFSLLSCKREGEKQRTVSAGLADFSSYVAVGNSLTAGYSDNSLYRSGQENSYPALLAGQFALAGGGAFRQPLLPGESGYPSNKLVLEYVRNCLGKQVLLPVVFSGPSDMAGASRSIAADGPFNNLGIPGIRCIDFLIKAYPAANPYSKRFFPNPNSESVMDLVDRSQHTFFTLWVGNNDILGYAVRGGEGKTEGLTLADISPLDLFSENFKALVASLTQNGAKGVVVNIPDVTLIPYFTAIDPKGLVLTRSEAEELTRIHNRYKIGFSEGANYYLVEDARESARVRQLKSDEYLLLSLPIDSLNCAGWGSIKPIPQRYVLSRDEVENIRSATAKFNEIVESEATKYGLAFFDADMFLRKVKQGIEWQGEHYSAEFVEGNAFSLDGIHLTERGYALVANELVKVINAHYQSTLPPVDVKKYKGNTKP